MKRMLCAALLAVLLVVNLPVTALAAIDYTKLPPACSWVHNGHTDLGTFDVLSMPEKDQALWKEMMSKPNNYFVMQSNFYVKDSDKPSGTVDYYFYYYPDGTTISGPVVDSNGYHKFTFSKPTIQFLSSVDSSSSNFEPVYTEQLLPIKNNTSVTSFLVKRGKFLPAPDGRYRGDLIIGGVCANANLTADDVNLSRTGDLYIRDNLTPEAPEPPPSSSSTPPVDPPSLPTVEQPPITYPSFPKVEGEFIPYDTTVWNEFANRIRGNIGSAVNIGFAILGVLLGIYVIIKIIRNFSHSGK